MFNKVSVTIFSLLFYFSAVCYAYGDVLDFDQNVIANKQSIIDTFSESTLNKNLKIKYIEKPKYYDFIINKDFTELYKNTIYPKNNKRITDNFAETNLIQYNTTKYPKKIYNFENINNVKVKIRPQKYISTKQSIREGEQVNFIVTEDVIKDNKVIIKKDEIIQGRIETISPNYNRGIPADLIIGSFRHKNISLDGEISKTGANRVYWVIPLSSIANMVLIGTGYPLWLIRGGHAKLKPKQLYEINLPEKY